MIVIHQKSERGAVRAATEAMVETFRRANGERGRLLVVKRATSLEFPARFFQLNPAPQDFNYVGPRYEVVNEMLGDETAHRSTPIAGGDILPMSYLIRWQRIQT